ncbi:MAG: PIN domain-containing protein [Deltaproteobacteria bacterium]|nr:PIN domain-containing protein [Deltaproteobacteria bacterium]
MKDKYILDSSIWIELERQSPNVTGQIKPFIEKNQVCLVDVIVAEVLRGVRTKQDFQILFAAFQNFRWLKTDWAKVAELGFKIAKKGHHPPLIDLYIALCTLENRRTLITQNKHFTHIAKIIPISLRYFAPSK